MASGRGGSAVPALFKGARYAGREGAQPRGLQRESGAHQRQRQDAGREGQDARQAGDALPRGHSERSRQAARSERSQ